jgi:ketosteroid isomerase-like protein
MSNDYRKGRLVSLGLDWINMIFNPLSAFVLTFFQTRVMRTFLLAFFLLSTYFLSAQSREEQKIRDLLISQTASWNRGDVEGFMQTYWKSDSLSFIGKSGVTRGWQNTLNNYKKGYPDTTAMGKLSFDILKVDQLSSKYAYVIGKWMLERSIGNLSGHYTLLLRKIRRKWVIVSDHSS